MRSLKHNRNISIAFPKICNRESCIITRSKHRLDRKLVHPKFRSIFIKRNFNAAQGFSIRTANKINTWETPQIIFHLITCNFTVFIRSIRDSNFYWRCGIAKAELFKAHKYICKMVHILFRILLNNFISSLFTFGIYNELRKIFTGKLRCISHMKTRRRHSLECRNVGDSRIFFQDTLHAIRHGRSLVNRRSVRQIKFHRELVAFRNRHEFYGARNNHNRAQDNTNNRHKNGQFGEPETSSQNAFIDKVRDALKRILALLFCFRF